MVTLSAKTLGRFIHSDTLGIQLQTIMCLGPNKKPPIDVDVRRVNVREFVSGHCILILRF